jgi:hypothetical protein
VIVVQGKDGAEVMPGTGEASVLLLAGAVST